VSDLVLPKVALRPEPRSVVRDRARFRARLLGGVLCVALAAVAVRGATLCLWPDPEVIHAGSAQRYDQVVLRARRGDLFDRDGRRLATSVDTPSVAVDPGLVPDEDVAEWSVAVAEIVGMDPADVAEKMRRESRYVKLAARVHPSVAAEIAALDHAGVWTHRDPYRYYPEETLGSQTIGFVDASGSGRAGLEEALDPVLRGQTVMVHRLRDRRGLDIDRPAALDLEANQGMDVHTTIDRRVQHATERALARVMEASKPLSASAVVIDVRTGDVLAMANLPAFNPNAIGDDPVPRKNHIVTDAIEPGSVFKPFTIAAAIEEGLAHPDERIDCEGGVWFIGRARVRDDHPHGVVTLAEVMKYSSNIGTAKMAFRLGSEKFVAYLRRFGFGEPTGIPLPGERRGRIRDPEKIKPIEIATTAFGQGVTATPLQLAVGIATIANDGQRMRPRLVTRVEDAYGVPERLHKPTAVVRAISPGTARAVTEMMVLVTETGGTGTRARIPGYRVAGKTGTAQKVKDGRYSEGRIGSFVGFVPADDPVIAIAVVVDEPSVGSRYGGIVAAPAFAEIGEATLRTLGVPPDPLLLEATPADVPPPYDDDPAPVRVAWLGDAWAMPDLSGRSMRDVLVAMQGTGLEVHLRGSGDAIAQSPGPGERVLPGAPVTVSFQ
jgi:cell division protein FtsI (penicillin-binding protein 3)